MDDVVDIERDFRRAKQGETLIYTTLHGLKTGNCLNLVFNMERIKDFHYFILINRSFTASHDA